MPDRNRSPPNSCHSHLKRARRPEGGSRDPMSNRGDFSTWRHPAPGLSTRGRGRRAKPDKESRLENSNNDRNMANTWISSDLDG